MPMAFIFCITSRLAVRSSISTITPGKPACTQSSRNCSDRPACTLHAAEIAQEVVGIVDRQDRLAVDLQITRVLEEILDPVRNDVVPPILGIRVARTLVGVHDRELLERAIARVEQPVADPLFQDSVLDRMVDRVVRPVPAVLFEVDAMFHLPLDFPVGHFGIALVVPAQDTACAGRRTGYT